MENDEGNGPKRHIDVSWTGMFFFFIVSPFNLPFFYSYQFKLLRQHATRYKGHTEQARTATPLCGGFFFTTTGEIGGTPMKRPIFLGGFIYYYTGRNWRSAEKRKYEGNKRGSRRVETRLERVVCLFLLSFYYY